MFLAGETLEARTLPPAEWKKEAVSEKRASLVAQPPGRPDPQLIFQPPVCPRSYDVGQERAAAQQVRDAWRRRRAGQASASRAPRFGTPISTRFLLNAGCWCPVHASPSATSPTARWAMTDHGATLDLKPMAASRSNPCPKPCPLCFCASQAILQEHGEVHLSALGVAISSLVTVAEMLKSRGLATEKKISTMLEARQDNEDAR